MTDFETGKMRDFEILRFWDFGILGFWDCEPDEFGFGSCVLEFRIFEIKNGHHYLLRNNNTQYDLTTIEIFAYSPASISNLIVAVPFNVVVVARRAVPVSL
jgi:hypothetical protein